MPLSPSASPQGGDPFADFVNKNNYIPVWLHPHVAAGVIRHFGRDGSALVHPHPHTTGGARPGMATGGIALPTPPATGAREAPPPPAGPPPMAAATAAGAAAPLAGIPAGIGAAGPAGRSIFGGGPVGAGGPAQAVPVFARTGRAIDARDGGKVPGKDLGRDSVHAMLEPGEAVFNKKQLAGIKPKPGKEHLLRSDQKKAMRGARNAVRK